MHSVSLFPWLIRSPFQDTVRLLKTAMDAGEWTVSSRLVRFACDSELTLLSLCCSCAESSFASCTAWIGAA